MSESINNGAESSAERSISIGSYPNLRDVEPNPLPERAAREQGMTAVHPADEGLQPHSPMHWPTHQDWGED